MMMRMMLSCYLLPLAAFAESQSQRQSFSLSFLSLSLNQTKLPGRRARQPEAVPERAHGQDGHRQAEVGDGVQR